MRAKKANLYKIVLVGGLAAALFAACNPQTVSLDVNPDPGVVLTSIVQTVEAKQQNYSLTKTAFPRNLAGKTETPGIKTGKGLQEISNADIQSPTFPDAARLVSIDPETLTRIPKNTGFSTTWELENAGSTVWSKDYQIIFFSGDRIGTGLPDKYKLGESVGPGEKIKISAKMVTGNSTGDYHSVWVLTNNQGVYFFPLNARITVVDH